MAGFEPKERTGLDLLMSEGQSYTLYNFQKNPKSYYPNDFKYEGDENIMDIEAFYLESNENSRYVLAPFDMKNPPPNINQTYILSRDPSYWDDYNEFVRGSVASNCKKLEDEIWKNKYTFDSHKCKQLMHEKNGCNTGTWAYSRCSNQKLKAVTPQPNGGRLTKKRRSKKRATKKRVPKIKSR